MMFVFIYVVSVVIFLKGWSFFFLKRVTFKMSYSYLLCRLQMIRGVGNFFNVQYAWWVQIIFHLRLNRADHQLHFYWYATYGRSIVIFLCLFKIWWEEKMCIKHQNKVKIFHLRIQTQNNWCWEIGNMLSCWFMVPILKHIYPWLFHGKLNMILFFFFFFLDVLLKWDIDK